MILDKKYLSKIILPGTVTLVEVASSNAQLNALISDLKEIPNIKLIFENGRNAAGLEDLLSQGFIPILLLGAQSINNMTNNVKTRITSHIKSKDYLNDIAVDVFIF